MANFSWRAYRFDFSEPRSYVFKSFGALLRLHGVDVALFWLIKPPRSRFCPHLLPTRRPQNILHRLPRAVIENYKISFEGQNRRTIYFLPLCRKKKKIQSTFSIPIHDNTFMIILFLTKESLKRSALYLEQWREFILKVIFHLLFLGLGINNW